MPDPETSLNSFLKKILAATGLTRRGELVEATEAIQRALAEASAGTAPRTARAEAPTSAAADPADVLDGLVREIDPGPTTPEEADTVPASPSSTSRPIRSCGAARRASPQAASPGKQGPVPSSCSSRRIATVAPCRWS
jgi:hypothetical protein